MVKKTGTGIRDILRGTEQADTLLGLGGNDDLFGKGGNDLLNGGAGLDRLLGAAGDDKLLGGLANDILRGGEGKDSLFGGDGLDTLLGEGGDDKLFGDSGADKLDGGDGKDQLSGGDGADQLFGRDGNDRLDGGAGNDKLFGGNHNDVLAGGAGADLLAGGSGVDWIAYDLGATAGVTVDFLAGTASGGTANGDSFSGIENARGTKFADSLSGNNGNNSLDGLGAGDTLVGRNGNDVLRGGAGSDQMTGGDGNDRLLPGADSDADVVDGGAGSDWVDYSDATGLVWINLTAGLAAIAAAGDSYISIENVQGSGFADQLIAKTDGSVFGGKGADMIGDSGGTETLRGGEGLDTLTDKVLGIDDGKKDYFWIEFNNGADTIIGFDQGTDQLMFSNTDFLELRIFDTLPAERLVNSDVPAATLHKAQFIFETDTSILWWDDDGIGGAPIFEVARLDGFTGSLTTDDFLMLNP